MVAGCPQIVGWKRGINLLRKGFRRKGLLTYWHRDSPHTYQVWQQVLVYDKKGNCEEFHEWLEKQRIRSITPVRKVTKRGRIRRQLMKKFPQKAYNKRNRVENVNFMFKNKYGDSLKAYTLKGRQA